MSGLKRYLNIVRAFSEHKAEWTIPELSQELGAPTSTLYRSVREMVAEGFLEPSREAHYRLGSAFVELDRLVRLTEPLCHFGTEVLDDVVDQARIPAVGLISRLYNDTVMCVVDAQSENLKFKSSFERGRPMPLTLGATSKVILAELPARRLAKLLKDAPGEGMTAEAISVLKAELNEVHRKGYCVTHGEIDSGLVGIAVPILLKQHSRTASLSLVCRAADLNDALIRRLVMLLTTAANILLERTELVAEA